MTNQIGLSKTKKLDRDSLFLIKSESASPSPGVVKAKDIYSMLLIGYNQYAGAANLTTTSASFVPISDTAFPPISADLKVGDTVWCKFSGVIYQTSTGYVHVDILVNQPISADHYIGQDVYAVSGGLSYCYGGVGQSQNIVIPYRAQENGTYTFQPVWRVTANTAYLMSGSNSNEDQTSFFSVGWCP